MNKKKADKAFSKGYKQMRVQVINKGLEGVSSAQLNVSLRDSKSLNNDKAFKLKEQILEL
jgi:hypothetical protein